MNGQDRFHLELVKFHKPQAGHRREFRFRNLRFWVEDKQHSAMVHEDDDGANQMMTYFKSDVFVQNPACRGKVIEMAWFYLITLLF